jgi:rhodanese-related sulfurtransferase
MYLNIDNSQFKKVVNSTNTVVFDGRTPKEVAEGQIAGTRSLPALTMRRSLKKR